MLCDFIKQKRQEKKMSLLELSKKTSRSIDSLIELERGLRLYITTPTARKISKALKFSDKEFKEHPNWIMDIKPASIPAELADSRM